MLVSKTDYQKFIRNLEQYDVAFSKTTVKNGDAEIVFRKKDFDALLDKYINSSIHLYDKPKIEAILASRIKQNGDVCATQVLGILNRKVSATFLDFIKHPSRYSIKVATTCLPLNRPSIVIVKKWSCRTLFEKYISSGPYTYDTTEVKRYLSASLKAHPRDKQLEIVLNILLGKAKRHDDIGPTVMRLEAVQKTTKRYFFEVDICQAFDIKDDSIAMGKWKGVCTVGDYNAYILCADEADREATRIHTHVSEIQNLLMKYPRGLLFLKQDPQSLHPFRLNEKGQVEMFDKELQYWVSCRDEDLRELGLNDSDLCFSLGLSAVEKMKREIVHQEETRRAERGRSDAFYQEVQEADSYCAIYAINHFLGYHALDVAEFYSFARHKMIVELGLKPETIYAKGQDVADIRLGADPKLVVDYLVGQAKAGKLPKEYAKMSVVEIKRAGIWEDNKLKTIPKKCDRIIVGYGGTHFAVLRKDAKDGRWYLIDSLDKTSQQRPYQSSVDAIMFTERAGPCTKNMCLIYAS